ncbi:uncharacterized protein LOC131939449 [Physella acuta]|uniref:uncharacterized protein LOC131939449 n=1 Tax=Physella acuta TaxID=109671 RepID=UPI0027DD951A|nr:uncharacterized protein LOC131939449 [Physella acuta]XP_059153725.1 uncharacterized protein LOC131939449 [Physella acuta]
MDVTSWLLWVATLSTLPNMAAGYYATSLDLDFLCSPPAGSLYVRDVPWDCSSYVICSSGRAIPTACPRGLLYANASRNSRCVAAQVADSSRCHGQVWDYIRAICHHNPTATVPYAERCSQYMDCGVEPGGHQFMDYLLECPYPSLYSTQTGSCQNYHYVTCAEREEPKAPCEYLQYLQLYNCSSPHCWECGRHHPSCVGLPNGRHRVTSRDDVIMECDTERTLNILTVPAATLESNAPLQAGISVI